MKKEGFILAATLWILAAITLAAGFFALWTNQVVELARENQEDIAGQIDMSNTRSVLLYLMATQRMTYAGLTVPAADKETNVIDLDKIEDVFQIMGMRLRPVGGEIGVDDRPYTGLGLARFSIQDEGGLLSLAVTTSDQIRRLENLLGLLGVPVEKRSPLLDKLQDYTDEDDLHRLNGAEARDYEENGLAPPANRSLWTTWEVGNVLGWKELLESGPTRKFPRLTTVNLGRVNINAAPELVLQSLPGMDDVSARRIIEARRQAPFLDLKGMFRAAGRSFSYDPISFSFVCSPYIRLTLWHKEAQHMREVHLKLTPHENKQAPWQIYCDLTYPLSDERKHASLQKVPYSVFSSPLSLQPQQP